MALYKYAYYYYHYYYYYCNCEVGCILLLLSPGIVRLVIHMFSEIVVAVSCILIICVVYVVVAIIIAVIRYRIFTAAVDC